MSNYYPDIEDTDDTLDQIEMSVGNAIMLLRDHFESAEPNEYVIHCCKALAFLRLANLELEQAHAIVRPLARSQFAEHGGDR